MDKEYKATRDVLGRARLKTAPVGLGDTVMRKVRAIEEKRIDRSIIWALVLRGACIAVFVCLLGGTLVSRAGGFGAVDWWRVVEVVEALGLLAVGIKVFRILV